MSEDANIEYQFGQILKSKREERQISQEKLAELCGLHRTYISLLERGIRQPTLATLFKLATALKISPSKLISELELEITKQ